MQPPKAVAATDVIQGTVLVLGASRGTNNLSPGR